MVTHLPSHSYANSYWICNKANENVSAVCLTTVDRWCIIPYWPWKPHSLLLWPRYLCLTVPFILHTWVCNAGQHYVVHDWHQLNAESLFSHINKLWIIPSCGNEMQKLAYRYTHVAFEGYNLGKLRPVSWKSDGISLTSNLEKSGYFTHYMYTVLIYLTVRQ